MRRVGGGGTPVCTVGGGTPPESVTDTCKCPSTHPPRLTRLPTHLPACPLARPSTQHPVPSTSLPPKKHAHIHSATPRVHHSLLYARVLASLSFPLIGCWGKWLAYIRPIEPQCPRRKGYLLLLSSQSVYSVSVQADPPGNDITTNTLTN